VIYIVFIIELGVIVLEALWTEASICYCMQTKQNRNYIHCHWFSNQQWRSWFRHPPPLWFYEFFLCSGWSCLLLSSTDHLCKNSYNFPNCHLSSATPWDTNPIVKNSLWHVLFNIFSHSKSLSVTPFSSSSLFSNLSVHSHCLNPSFLSNLSYLNFVASVTLTVQLISSCW